MKSGDYRPLLAIACRFGTSLNRLEVRRNADHKPLYYRTTVPYDQWFITHLDDKQKVKQVKHWILSKCNIIQTPHLSAQRPVSPITFASSIRPRSSADSMEEGYNEDDEYDEDSDDFDDFSYRHPELRRQNIHARRPGKSSSSAVPASSSQTVQPGSSPVTDQYTLVSFSTGAILEDDYALSWYSLRPYELLEMHRAGKVVQLPREILSEYTQPYFEAKGRALRAIWSPKSGRFESPTKHKINRNSYSPRSRDKMSMPPLQPERKRRRAKVEWKDRWIVINQGTLSLCKDSTVSPSNLQLYRMLISRLPGRSPCSPLSTHIITGASWRGVSCKGLFHHRRTAGCLSQVSQQGIQSISRCSLITVSPLLTDCRRLEDRRTHRTKRHNRSVGETYPHLKRDSRQSRSQ